ncbi:MAG: response regulator [Asticcacaulis sp.]|uniref:response regulator n=1 Tax=Asticcacaulis sp. TaxID=1872648 RepID=UPI0039E4227E
MTTPSQRILVVDDDPELRQHVAEYLSENGFTVQAAENGTAMDKALAVHMFDVVVLDLMMPGEDGLSICKRLNGINGPGIIMVSASGAEVDRVLGLELGADDYLAKPFSPRELLARVRALVRRRENAALGGLRRGEVFTFSDFTYDPVKRQLRAPSGVMVLLTLSEALLLGLLLSQARTVLSREALQAVEVSGGTGRSVDIVISRLRKKLEMNGGGNLIRTERGQGYILEAQVIRA